MSELAVAFERVSKRYSAWPGGARTLRGVLTRRVPLLGRSGHRWALRDVTFSVPAGGSLGVIGSNGAGKSTLLRLAAGLGRASEGRIAAIGDAAAVLNLGDLFDPVLTGRENALTAALVDGWSANAARALIPRVIEFAELDEHIDAPVRTYSDGMRMRLAFGVVAQLEPRLLLVDEVLAVGDLAFQAKCAERIAAMRAAGTALLLASHDLGLVERECESAIWLERGSVRAVGPSAEVVEAYRQAAHERVVSATPAGIGASPAGLELGTTRVGTQQVTIEDVRLAPSAVSAGEPLALSLELRNHSDPVLDPIVDVKITRESDEVLCYRTSTRTAGIALGRIADKATITLTLDRLDLAPGRYVVDVAAYSADWETTFDYHWHAYPVVVAGDPGDGGVLEAPARWERDAAHRSREDADEEGED